MGHFMARIAVRLSGDYGCTMTQVIIGLERHFVTWTFCPLCALIKLSISSHLIPFVK